MISDHNLTFMRDMSWRKHKWIVISLLCPALLVYWVLSVVIHRFICILKPGSYKNLSRPFQCIDAIKWYNTRAIYSSTVYFSVLVKVDTKIVANPSAMKLLNTLNTWCLFRHVHVLKNHLGVHPVEDVVNRNSPFYCNYIRVLPHAHAFITSI